MSEVLKQGYITEDGSVFDNKADAQDYLRRPIVKEAFVALTDGNDELADWMVGNGSLVTNAFEKGTIKRVTKSERKKLIAGLEKVSEIFKADGTKALEFLANNAEALAEGFRWPTVKRLTEDEKASAIKEEITEATDGNESLAVWMVENREAIMIAYDAGKPKREVSPKASAALAKYRKEQADKKAAAEGAAPAAAPEAAPAAA